MWENVRMSEDGTGPRLVTVDEAAARLGVKQETIYAYVSRGLLNRVRTSGSRASLFAEVDVEQLANRRGEGRPRGSANQRPGTELSAIVDGRLLYRGVDAVTLAENRSFEEVTGWLWSGSLEEASPFRSAPVSVTGARAALDTLPPGARLTDRIRVTTAVAAVWDPMRFDLRVDAVITTGRTLVSTLVDALPEPGPAGTSAQAPLAERLWSRLSGEPASPELVDLLNLAMVLLAEHGTAPSTVAVRTAAGVRAHPYAVVSTGLGAFEGPLHGSASAFAYEMLAETLAGRPAEAVVSDLLRAGRPVPGIGHTLYHAGDPRARALLARIYELPIDPAVRAAADTLLDVVSQRSPAHPNIDFALAVLTHACGLSSDSGEAIMVIARSVGWIAHALEVYQRAPQAAIAGSAR
jgi:citrate synthase